MVKATQLTENSWLMQTKTQRIGLLTLGNSGYRLIGGPFDGEYVDTKSLEDKVGTVTFVKPKNESKQDDKMLEIEGFPVKHDQYFLVDSTDDFHTYVKREGSEDYYLAGYFCIQFNGKWQPAFCPRVNTLSEYAFKGPFKDKLTMNHTIRVENGK